MSMALLQLPEEPGQDSCREQHQGRAEPRGEATALPPLRCQLPRCSLGPGLPSALGGSAAEGLGAEGAAPSQQLPHGQELPLLVLLFSSSETLPPGNRKGSHTQGLPSGSSPHSGPRCPPEVAAGGSAAAASTPPVAPYLEQPRGSSWEEVKVVLFWSLSRKKVPCGGAGSLGPHSSWVQSGLQGRGFGGGFGLFCSDNCAFSLLLLAVPSSKVSAAAAASLPTQHCPKPSLGPAPISAPSEGVVGGRGFVFNPNGHKFPPGPVALPLLGQGFLGGSTLKSLQPCLSSFVTLPSCQSLSQE